MNSTCYKLCSNPSQASNVAVDSAAYGALLTACALSPDASPTHDWALSTLETMQVCVLIFTPHLLNMLSIWHLILCVCDSFCGFSRKVSHLTPTLIAQCCVCAVGPPFTFKPRATSTELVRCSIMLLESMLEWSNPICISATEPL